MYGDEGGVGVQAMMMMMVRRVGDDVLCGLRLRWCRSGDDEVR